MDKRKPDIYRSQYKCATGTMAILTEDDTIALRPIELRQAEFNHHPGGRRRLWPLGIDRRTKGNAHIGWLVRIEIGGWSVGVA